MDTLDDKFWWCIDKSAEDAAREMRFRAAMIAQMAGAENVARQIMELPPIEPKAN